MLDKNDINTIDLISELKDEQPTGSNLTNDIEIFKTELKHKINKGDVEGVLGQLGADVITLKERINTKVDNTLFEYTNKINEKAIDSKVSPEYVDVAINKALCNKFVLKSELPDFKNIDFSKFVNREDLRFKADKEDVEKKADKAELINLVHVDDLEIFAKKSDIENCAKISDLSRYAARTDLYDLATKEENELKADKAELRKYATKEENELKADKLELNKYALKTDLPNMSNYAFVHDVALKADKSTLELYAKQTDLNNKLDRDMLKILATKEELNLKANQADLNLYASKDALYNKVDKTELEKYALVSDLNNKVDKITAANYATKDEVAEKLCIKEAEKFATKCELNSKANKTDLVNFATRDELDLIRKFNPQKLQEIALRVEDVLDFSTKLGEVAYKKDIKELPNKVSKIEFERELGLYKEYISDLLNLKADQVSLSELATKEELRIKLTPKADRVYVDERLDSKAEKADVEVKVETINKKIELLKQNTTTDLTKGLADKVGIEEFNLVKTQLEKVNEVQDGFIKQNADKIMEAISKEAENHLLQELSIKATKEDVAKNLELITTNKAELVELVYNSKLELGNTLTEKINLLNESLELAKQSLNDLINTKADLTFVNRIKTGLDTKIDTKADKTDLDAYVTKIEAVDFAKKTDLDVISTLATKESLNLKAETTYVDGVKNELTTLINGKANKATVDVLVGEVAALKGIDVGLEAGQVTDAKLAPVVERLNVINNEVLPTLATKDEVSLKADKTVLNNYALKTDLDTKVNNTDLDLVKKDVLANTTNLTTKADKTDVYTKLEVDNKIDANKVDISGLATKESLDLKANSLDVYTKTEVDTKLQNVTIDTTGLATKEELGNYALKTELPSVDGLASKTDVYTKTEIDAKLQGLSTAGSNTPSVDLTNYYNKTEIDAALLNKANEADFQALKTQFETTESLSLNDVVEGVKLGFNQGGVLYTIIEPLLTRIAALEAKVQALETTNAQP